MSVKPSVFIASMFKISSTYYPYLLAPLVGPVCWFISGSLSQGVSLYTVVLRLIFLLLLALHSCLICIPVLVIFSPWFQLHRKIDWIDYVLGAGIALLAGIVFSQPLFQDAQRHTQGIIAASFLLAFSLIAFFSLSATSQDFPATVNYQSDTSALSLFRGQSAWGLVSIFNGIVALGLALMLGHLGTLGHLSLPLPVLPFLHGPANMLEETYVSSIYEVSGGNLIVWMYASMHMLAVAALSTALVARLKREDSLYRAVGCIFGGLALAILEPISAVLAFAIYGIISRIAVSKHHVC